MKEGNDMNMLLFGKGALIGAVVAALIWITARYKLPEDASALSETSVTVVVILAYIGFIVCYFVYLLPPFC